MFAKKREKSINETMWNALREKALKENDTGLLKSIVEIEYQTYKEIEFKVHFNERYSRLWQSEV